MLHSLMNFSRKAPAFAVLALFALTPGAALAQFDEEGLGIAEGLYDNEGPAEDNWFYDSYGRNYPGGYGQVGFGEDDEESLLGGYEDYGGYYEEGEFEDD